MKQALVFLQDLKLGHYMKIPPRTMFMAQVSYSTHPWKSIVFREMVKCFRNYQSITTYLIQSRGIEFDQLMPKLRETIKIYHPEKFSDTQAE